MITKQHFVFVAMVLNLAVLLPLRAGEFYVAPSGQPGGDGSLSRPWDLQSALNQPATVKPGDIIWLRGGIYHGTYTSALTGTASAPIVVRQYPGERATIDGADPSERPILVVNGSYAWYWGFEVMSSATTRVSTQSGPWPTDIPFGEGVQAVNSSIPKNGPAFPRCAYDSHAWLAKKSVTAAEAAHHAKVRPT